MCVCVHVRKCVRVEGSSGFRVVHLNVGEMFYHMLSRQNYCLAWTCMPKVLKYDIHTALKAGACSIIITPGQERRKSLVLCFEGARTHYCPLVLIFVREI